MGKWMFRNKGSDVATTSTGAVQQFAFASVSCCFSAAAGA